MAKRKRNRRASSKDVNKKLDLIVLPSEILAEIMSRFSAKSVMGFKLVSKSWCSMIGDPVFLANLHLRAEARPTVIILNEPSPQKDQTLGRKVRKMFSTILTGFDAKKGKFRCLTNDVDVSNYLLNRFKVLYCNGIVCVESDHDSAITLYNPAMNKSATFRPKPVDGDGRECSFEAIGFGSDSESANFKLVRIVRSWTKKTAEVYDMGESDGDTWREVEFPVRVRKWMNNLSSEAVYAKGRCHWLVEDPPMCLSFDVAGESFRAVDLPSELISAKYFRSHTRLAARKGSLYLVYYPPWQPMGVWAIESDKWVRVGIHPDGLGKPFYHWSSGEMVVRTNGGHVESYNIGTETFKRLSPNGDLGRIHYLGPHVDSLASVMWMIKHARPGLGK